MLIVHGLKDNDRGTAQVEQLVLLVTVAIGFAGAALALGPALLAYHRTVELVLALPIP